LKTSKLAFTLITLLFLSITTYQQIQIINLQNLIVNHNEVKYYLMANHGVSSIDELIQKKLEEYGSRYTGNPFTTALYPGQLQAENITGMHWYTYRGGSLLNRTDVVQYPEQTATFVIFGEDIDDDGTYDIIYAKNTTSGQIQYGGSWDAGGVNGADAATVIQATINACSNGIIFIKKGTYIYSSTLTINKNSLFLVGEGKGVTILNYTGTGNAIYIGDDLVRVGVMDLTIQSDGGDSHALFLKAIESGRFENLFIYNHGGRGIYCDAGDGELKWNQFINIEINSCNYGITLTSSGSTRCNANRFINIRLWGITNRGFEILNSKGDTNLLLNVGFYGCPLFINDWENYIIAPRLEGTNAYIEFGVDRGKNNIVIGSGLGERLRGDYYENVIISTDQAKILNYANVRKLRTFYAEFVGELSPFGSSVSGSASVSITKGGILRESTGATVNSHTIVNTQDTCPCDPSKEFKLKFVRAKLYQTTYILRRLGLYRDSNNYIWFELNESSGGSANWFAISCSGGSSTSVDTGVSADTPAHTFEIIRTSSGLEFYIDDSLVATITDNIPTLCLDIHLYLENLEAADKYTDVEAIWFESER